MKVRFKGIKRERQSRGCGCRKRHGSRISTIKPFHLPSGTKVVFRVGQQMNVSDEDGAFLLNQFPDAFERV